MSDHLSGVPANPVFVVKLGGAALKAGLENPALLENLARCPQQLIVVHGGGPAITHIAKALGIESEFIDGQRVTTPAMVDVVEMVLSGNVNSKIVRAFTKAGRRALGVSGTDDKLLECVPENPKLLQVGRVERVNTALLTQLLAQGYSPVISPVGLFGDFSACNVNADLAATRIASDLKAERFLFITDTNGIFDTRGATLPTVSVSALRAMCGSGVVSGGMKVKARAILEYLERHPTGSAQIINGLDPAAFAAFLSGEPSGTLIHN